MLIKKKEIIAAALVVLIGCAGYLNWSYRDAMIVRDGESYIETGKRLGEVQLVNSETETEDDSSAQETSAPNEESYKDAQETETQSSQENDTSYFENAKYERDDARSKTMEILNSTCANGDFDEETRHKAGDKIIAETQNMEAEQRSEGIAKSKGYDEICIYIHDEKAVVTVRKENFNADDALRLSEIVQEQSGIGGNNIKVVNVE